MSREHRQLATASYAVTTTDERASEQENVGKAGSLKLDYGRREDHQEAPGDSKS